VGITFRHADRICHACRRACFTISKGRTSAFLTSMRLCPVRMQRHRISQRTDTEDLALGDTAVDILIWASGLHLSSAHGSEQQVCEERLVGLRFSPLCTPIPQIQRSGSSECCWYLTGRFFDTSHLIIPYCHPDVNRHLYPAGLGCYRGCGV
jgi:hypothetical protein